MVELKLPQVNIMLVKVKTTPVKAKATLVVVKTGGMKSKVSKSCQ